MGKVNTIMGATKIVMQITNRTLSFRVNSMNYGHLVLRIIKTICLVLIFGASMSAEAGLFGFGGESWKEEVLLHDGSKLIVERSQTRGGNHEIGQEVPIAEHKISVELPGSNEVINWRSTYGYDRDNSNLILLAFDLINGVPYIVTTISICPAYNKWDRPNPPYVFFKYNGKIWQRIPLEEFPKEIKEANVVNNTDDHGHELDRHAGIITAHEINEINGSYRQDVLYQKMFVRQPINNEITNCSKFE